MNESMEMENNKIENNEDVSHLEITNEGIADKSIEEGINSVEKRQDTLESLTGPEMIEQVKKAPEEKRQKIMDSLDKLQKQYDKNAHRRKYVPISAESSGTLGFFNAALKIAMKFQEIKLKLTE
jgi:hypothetical protein